MAIYLDCNATTPMDPEVLDQMMGWLTTEVGNEGSRTHEHGARAKRAVQRSRAIIAEVVDAAPEEVVFTSGATESNNLAILGLATYARNTEKKHIVVTEIEHKSVIEPVQALEGQGFQVSRVRPTPGGYVTAEAILGAMRDDTVLVSVMHANNETGIVQPINEIADAIEAHDAFLHVDGAQGFGKEFNSLCNKRIDLISVTSHKIFGPMGVGALITRRRQGARLPITPLTYGGGQERSLRPGTLPVALIVGFGAAVVCAKRDASVRLQRCAAIRVQALEALRPIGICENGEPSKALPHVLNFFIPGLDSEALIVATKNLVSVSNGSACTSSSYAPSHVLVAMGLQEEAIRGALRLSWCHLTPEIDWSAIAARIRTLL